MQWKPNVTVSAVIEKNGSFLIIEESVDDKIVLNQPSGHLEHKESIIDAVKREVLEETAWEIEPEYIIGLYLYPKPDSDITYLRICFYCRCIKHHNNNRLDDDILQIMWMSKEEIESNSDKLRSCMVLDCIEDYLSGKQFPLTILHHYE